MSVWYLLCTKYIFNQMSSRKALGLESYRHLVRLESSATCIENRQFSNRRDVCKPTQSANQSALLLTVAANKTILGGTQATSPEGVKRTQIQVASLQPGPLDDGSPGDGKRPIEVAYPGSTSADGRFSFNPADFNRPVTTNTTLNKAVLVVTDLTEGKVKHSIEVPLPGLPKGTYFNFQADFFPLSLAGLGKAQRELGPFTTKYVAAGSPVGDEYPVYLVLNAWSCKNRDFNGQRYTQRFFTKYAYNARTGNLSWSGVRHEIYSCTGEDKVPGSIESSAVGFALGAEDNTGFFIAGPTGGSEDTLVYKLNGKTLTKVFTQPSLQDISELTLLSASGTSDILKFAGLYTPYGSQSEIRLFGYAGAKVSILSGFKVKPDEFVSALANDAGALYALVVHGSLTESLGRLVTVYKIGPFALDVAGGNPTPTTTKQVFVLDSKWAASLEVVGEP